jgi:hypothetical protein
LLGLLAEARLFFDFLREDYRSALASLEALEPLLTTRDQRVRLLGVRAQVFLGLNQTDQARKTIAFLQAIDPGPGRRLEQTSAGPAMTGEIEPTRKWSSYLLERTGELIKAAAGSSNDNPLGHHNPDNPNPNADLVPGPAGAPIPFAPMIQVAPPFLPVFPEFEEQAPGAAKEPVFPRRPSQLRRDPGPAPRP